MSYLTTSAGTLKAQVITALEGQGFAYDPLRTTFTQYLATALGDPTAYLHKSMAQMLSEIDAQYGGSLSHLTSSIAQLLDDVAVNIGAGGGGGGYVAKAVHCADGTAYLSCPSLSCSDNGLFSMSFWFKTSAASYGSNIGRPFFWAADPLGHYATLMDSNLNTEGGIPVAGDTWSPFFQKVGGSNNFVLDNSSSVFDGVWHHALFSLDTNFAQGQKRGKFYIDNIDNSYIANDFLDAFQASFNGLLFAILDDTYGEGFIGDIADMWVAPGISLLDGSGDIPQANRALFIDQSTGKPVDPINFPSAPMLFSGDATGFVANQGTGGSFGLTGSLINASTSPSD